MVFPLEGVASPYSIRTFPSILCIYEVLSRILASRKKIGYAKNPNGLECFSF